MYGTHKTVAVGVPLINAIYENDPMVGYHTLPLLIWHPMQLVLGTVICELATICIGNDPARLTLNRNSFTTSGTAVAPRIADYVNIRETTNSERSDGDVVCTDE